MTPSQIAQAMREAAAKVSEAYGNDGNPDIHNEPVSVATGIETASREIAAAIRSIPIPDYSEWVLVPREPIEPLRQWYGQDHEDSITLSRTEVGYLLGVHPRPEISAAKEASND